MLENIVRENDLEVTAIHLRTRNCFLLITNQEFDCINQTLTF